MTKEENRAIEDSRCLIYELNNHKDKDFIGRLYYKNKPIEENLEILLNLIEKLQKENEELLEVKVSTSAHNRILELEKENEELKERIREHTLLISPYYIKENYIPIQKIKDKIEELKKKVEELTDDKGYWGGSDLLDQIEVLQELLESEE